MDAKALAKSKRAHSQHHSKKSHSSHKPKASSDVFEKAKNTVKSRRESELPSNWDRYHEELDSGLENPSSLYQPSDVILRKSKGADYRHLINEAQAESQSKMNISSDVLSSLDDLLHDEFSRLVGSMLSARGEGIISWVGDDNFVVEDGSASSHEASFLSLNLNALAEQLEKVDLHERLYIEADILPPELRTAKPESSSDHEPYYLRTTQDSEAVTTALGEPDHQGFTEKLQVTDEHGIFEPVVSQGDLLSGLELIAGDQVKDIRLTSGQLEQSSVSKKKSLAFEGTTSAEAEIDMLLNSFDEANVQEIYKPPLVQSSATRASSSTPQPPTASFDDVLDDLLEQTSGLEKPRDVVSQPQKNLASSSSSSKPVGKSELLDDFDSWLDTI